jgi:hypothetical protein
VQKQEFLAAFQKLYNYAKAWTHTHRLFWIKRSNVSSSRVFDF